LVSILNGAEGPSRKALTFFAASSSASYVSVNGRVPLVESAGVVKTQNSLAVFFAPRDGQSWWRIEAL